MMAFLVGLVAVATLQATLVRHLAIAGVQPDLFLVLTIALALPLRVEAATAAGFVLGLYQDALSGAPLGLRALTLTLIAFLVARVAEELDATRLSAQGVLLLAGGLVSGLTMWATMSFFLGPRPLLEDLLRVIVPEAAYSAAVGLAALATLRAARRLRARA